MTVCSDSISAMWKIIPVVRYEEKIGKGKLRSWNSSGLHEAMTQIQELKWRAFSQRLRKWNKKNIHIPFPMLFGLALELCSFWDVFGLGVLLRLGNPAGHAEPGPEQSSSVLLSMTALMPTAQNLSVQSSE